MVTEQSGVMHYSKRVTEWNLRPAPLGQLLATHAHNHTAHVMLNNPAEMGHTSFCEGDETGDVETLSEGGRLGGTGSPPRQRWMMYIAMANSLMVRAPSPSASAKVHI